MITTIVQFRLPKPLSREQACAIFASTAPKYRDLPGLVRKCYLLSDDGGTAGGVYLWTSRQAAENVYTDEWRRIVREKYGSEPSVTYFDSPVIVDNVAGEIQTAG